MIYLLLTISVFVFVLAAFFAGSETGLYSLSRLNIRIGRRSGKKSFDVAHKLVRDSQSLILTTLTGTNISHYLITSLVTSMFLIKGAGEEQAEFYATIILTPSLFIFAEVLPKNIFHYQADRLMPLFAYLLWGVHRLFSMIGLIWLLSFIIRLLSKLFRLENVTRHLIDNTQTHHISEFAQETKNEGALSEMQSGLIGALVDISAVEAAKIAQSISKDIMINIKSGRDDILESLKQTDERFRLVYKGAKREIVGYLDIYDAVNSGEFVGLDKFIKPMVSAGADESILKVLRSMAAEDVEVVVLNRSKLSGKVKETGFVSRRRIFAELMKEV